jgi:hypothetical protein
MSDEVAIALISALATFATAAVGNAFALWRTRDAVRKNSAAAAEGKTVLDGLVVQTQNVATAINGRFDEFRRDTAAAYANALELSVAAVKAEAEKILAQRTDELTSQVAALEAQVKTLTFVARARIGRAEREGTIDGKTEGETRSQASPLAI